MSHSYAKHLAWQLVAGEAVIVDLSSGSTLGLNETGSFIWSLIPVQSPAEIAEMVSEKFGIPVSDARRDVDSFLELLSDRRLIDSN